MQVISEDERNGRRSQETSDRKDDITRHKEETEDMKATKRTLVILAAALATFGFGANVYAFHSGGVAECTGCHSMHSPAPGGSFLLKGTDDSSTCLNCHAHQGDTGPSSYHIMTYTSDMPTGTPPLQRGPGGDFGWLQKTYTFSPRTGETTTEAGQTHGHNIIAVDYGYTVDTDNVTAPGGTFASSQLACTSCHDPHGKARRLSTGAIDTGGAPIIASGSYDNSPVPAAGQAVGVYRLLAGNGYTMGAASFTGVPQAVAPATYNRTEAASMTRVAYGAADTDGHVTWGHWCGTCHGDMHSSGNYVHPTDEALGADIGLIYNQYRGTGVPTGTAADAYLSLVPFFEASATYATLATHARRTNNYTNGPATSDQVSCMSCHRAHATGFAEALRWNMDGEMILINGSWPGSDAPVAEAQAAKWAQGRTYAEMRGAYYENPESRFGSYQRVLCNKCHAKD